MPESFVEKKVRLMVARLKRELKPSASRRISDRGRSRLQARINKLQAEGAAAKTKRLKAKPVGSGPKPKVPAALPALPPSSTQTGPPRIGTTDWRKKQMEKKLKAESKLAHRGSTMSPTQKAAFLETKEGKAWLAQEDKHRKAREESKQKVRKEEERLRLKKKPGYIPPPLPKSDGGARRGERLDYRLAQRNRTLGVRS